MDRSYRIVLLSPIPAFQHEGMFTTLDLWVRDLAAQAIVSDVDLICPVRMGEPETPQFNSPIGREIRVHDYGKLGSEDLHALLRSADVVQLPGNAGWRHSAAALRLLSMARKCGCKVILGVSSNRAKSALINSSGKGLLRSAKSLFDFLDIRTCQSWLALKSDGVFVVGDGVAQLFRLTHANLHIGIASWIEAGDIAPLRSDAGSATLRLCMASRFERMKGLHIGIFAVQDLVARGGDVALTIIGAGPEKANLHEQVSAAGLSAVTCFKEPVSYPQPFFDFLDRCDVALLTNLSNEQPRLIFDAISRGCIPLCPDTAPYQAIGLDRTLLYRPGDWRSLSRAIEPLLDIGTRSALREDLLRMAGKFTISSMHASRATWVRSLLEARVPK